MSAHAATPDRAPCALAIETSNPSAGEGAPSAGVALGRLASGAVRTLATEPLSITDRRSDDLMPAVARLCAIAGVRPVEIGLIAVSVGPGAYTALRIAVTCAKVLAEVTGARCVAVPTALALGRSAPPGRGLVCLASKHGTTHATGLADGVPIDEGRVIGAADLAALVRGGVAWLLADRFLPEDLAAEAARLGVPVHRPVFDPVAVLHAAAVLPAAGPDELAERYAREPDAVTQWRARHG